MTRQRARNLHVVWVLATIPIATAEAQSAASAEDTTSVGLRLEAQILGAMSLAFAGQPGGTAFGFMFSYGVGWGEIPLLAGLDFMSVGRDSQATSVPTMVDGETLPEVTRSSSDRLLDFDFWVRAQPPRWAIRPYAEVFIGAKLVQTDHAIANGDTAQQKGSDHAWASALGWGVGLDLMGLFNPDATYALTLGMRRLRATSIELERPAVVDGRGSVVKEGTGNDETILMAGMCGRFGYTQPE